MCNVDAHCTLGREEAQTRNTQRILCFVFSCPALKYKFYFISMKAKYFPKCGHWTIACHISIMWLASGMMVPEKNKLV